ncbi:methylmalonyl-CoA mutase family protein [Caldibacillus lycopersici]|uniref:Methylmalonyl-CoA mutase family protein n=1 Tax=Perspicuibacillus lycopersici TaxID=1325689 RepID=A0AAE3IVT3_9BACI|nr:methylmalonyl-CoA mutase family protein [Perspicuibacillus lycopersici]MCU9613814.1 methylmalonyl-CoA mutase family protein [Perspicuibacillus lycopersici]
MKKVESTITDIRKYRFPVLTYEEWVKHAEKALKGKSLREYDYPLDETNKMKPLYDEGDRDNDTKQIHPIISDNPDWYLAQKVYGQTSTDINRALHNALENGQKILSFDLDPNWSVTDLQRVLKDVEVANASFFIDGKVNTIPFYPMIVEWVERTDIENQSIKGFIGGDPIAYIYQNALSKTDSEKYYQYWSNGIQYALEQLPNVKTIYVDGTMYGNAGGNVIQQLAYSLATAVEHITILHATGLSLEAIFSRLQFGFAISSNFFLEISKLRAAKYLWEKLKEAYSVTSNDGIDLYAETTIINKSQIDVYTNLLRIGGEALAAVIGQVKYLRINSFDEVTGTISDLGIRLSHNIHHIFKEEAKLAAVSDPSGGSYYIESLTKMLIEKAWHLFLQVEEAGGMLAEILNGGVQRQLEENKKQTLDDFQNRTCTLIGTNRYVNNLERLEISSQKENTLTLAVPISIPKLSAEVKKGAALGNFLKTSVKSTSSYLPISFFRLSEQYESIRNKANQYFQKHAHPLTVGMVCFGERKSWQTIADYCSDFLASGGIHTVQSQGIRHISEAEAFIKETKFPAYCFCWKDDDSNWESQILTIATLFPDKQWILTNPTSLPLQNKLEIHPKVNQQKLLTNLFQRIGGLAE